MKANKETLTEEERSSFEVYLEYTGLDEEGALLLIGNNRWIHRHDRKLLERALPEAIHGRKFIESSHRPRPLDALGEVMVEAFKELLERLGHEVAART